MAEELNYSTGELARKAEVSQRTIRYYEELGLIQPASRLPGGRRLFSDDTLQRLRFITRLKKVGLSLEEMHHINQVFSIEGSTTFMLQEVDCILQDHLRRIESRRKELQQVEADITEFRRQIGDRIQAANHQSP